ncbi:hypothetical protein L1987_54663 [Smallanthus sonchifolius]|uniref:Uncharacterized protein n=1 Tax=Smallanthus sonchifolius TaxID=185202 RepID=A0ACB9E8U2_9ASTR|nr:hypothetical protein L1987_54663 [Smallanthus sonchifolius]
MLIVDESCQMGNFWYGSDWRLPLIIASLKIYILHKRETLLGNPPDLQDFVGSKSLILFYFQWKAKGGCAELVP